ncbi:MAG: hypothetical protein WCH13_08560, partial [Deltaproteobacteria bacterium]
MLRATTAAVLGLILWFGVASEAAAKMPCPEVLAGVEKAGAGKSPEDIATELGIPPRRVRACLRKSGAKDEDGNPFKGLRRAKRDGEAGDGGAPARDAVLLHLVGEAGERLRQPRDLVRREVDLGDRARHPDVQRLGHRAQPRALVGARLAVQLRPRPSEVVHGREVCDARVVRSEGEGGHRSSLADSRSAPSGDPALQ